MTKHEEKALRISGDFFSHQPVSEDFFFFAVGEGILRFCRGLALAKQKADGIGSAVHRAT